jgi:cytochrome c-type biogenesis protein CcmH/NrfF
MSNDDDVLNWFRKNWGVTAVVEPGSHGLELWAWVLPRLAFWSGLVVAIVMVLKWRSRAAHTPAPAAKLDPHLEALRDRARRETQL